MIAAFMPLTTALLAVLRTHERVPWQFWAAASAGTGALLAFALSRGGAEGGDLYADALGIARGGQVQQLQALLTVVWSALLLDERVTLRWSRRSR